MIGGVDGTSKITKWLNYKEIKARFLASIPGISRGEITYRKFYQEEIVPFIPEGEVYTEGEFRNWYKRMERYARGLLQEGTGKTLLEKETIKQRKQIEIRQDVTDLMGQLITTLKEIADNPDKLRNSGIKIQDLYKIIREEEDRAKLLWLKERAENRADAQFAFFVSLAKANQLSDQDVEFLEAETLKELKLFKRAHGVYALEATTPVQRLIAPAEAPAGGATEGDSEGAV